MSNEWDAPVFKPKRRWLRRLLWSSGSVVLLLLFLYFVVTSAWFFKRSILPRIGKAANAHITVRDASISPFRYITLQGLQVRPGPGAPPLASIKEVSARYSLLDILGGKINVAAVTISDPVIEWIENADGTSNLDPLIHRPDSESPAEPPPNPKPLQLALGKLQINNATVRRVKLRADGSREVAEMNGLVLTVEDVGNRRSAILSLSSQLRFDGQALVGGFSSNLLEADLNCALNFALTDDLKPQNLSGDVSIDVSKAPAVFSDYAGLSVALHCVATPTDLEQFSIILKNKTATLAKVSAHGPFELAKQEGRLQLEVGGIDQTLLNLAGAKVGLVFGNTSISATQEIALLDSGRSITVAGRLGVNQLNALRDGVVSPSLDLQLDYGVALDRSQSKAELKQLLLHASQNGVSFLQGTLTRPTTIYFAALSNTVTDSAFYLGVTNLNLGDWKPLIGDYVARVNAGLEVTTQDAGRSLGIKFATDLTNAVVSLGSNRLSDAALQLSCEARVEQFAKVHVTELRGTLSEGNQRVLSASLSGDYDKTQEADLQTRIEVDLPALLRLAPLPGVHVTAGVLTLKTRVMQKHGATADGLITTIEGDLQLNHVAGRSGMYAWPAFQLNLDWDGSRQGNAVQVKRLSGRMSRDAQFGGAFEVSAAYDLASKVADVSLNLSNVNQMILAPLAQPSLGGKTLRTLALSANTTARLLPSGDSTFAGTIQVSEVLIDDPQGQLPKVPVSVDLKIDGSFRTNFIILRELAANLRVGDLPGGSLTTSGQFDLAKKGGRVTLNVGDLNENTVRAFAGSAFGERSLKSVAMTADLTAAYDPAGESSIRGQLAVKNLRISDPSGAFPGDPLSASLQVDGSLVKKLAHLRTLQLQLSPTARANNLLAVTGRLDFARSNALDGDVMISSESLDLTPYYDMFVRRRATNMVVAQPPAPSSQTPPPESPTEPAPIVLPIQRLGVRWTANRFYLREVAVRDWNAGVKIEGSRVIVKPFDLVLNGAAVRADADVNLGVSGYDYALAYASERLSIEPLMNSFAPEQQGRIKGDLIADVHIRGAGVTGRSLRKNLSGQFGVLFTNANLQITKPWAREFLSAVALLLQTPELLNSPVSSVGTQGQIRDGKISVRPLAINSDTFSANTAGEVRMADVLTNSPLDGWPVHFAVGRHLAGRIGLATRDHSPGTAYVSLPDFIRVGGTLGDPKPLLDKAALARTTLDKLKGNLPSFQKPGLQTPSFPSTPSTPSTPAAPNLKLPIVR